MTRHWIDRSHWCWTARSAWETRFRIVNPDCGGDATRDSTVESGSNPIMHAQRNGEERASLDADLARALVDSAQDYAIYMLDPNGIVASWNIGAERIKGYKADEIIGSHFSRFYPPDVAASGQ